MKKGLDNLMKFIIGLFIFLLFSMFINYLLYRGYFSDNIVYWINKCPEPGLSRISLSILLTSGIWLMTISSPLKINVGFINIDNTDVRKLLKPLLPLPFLFVLAIISASALYLSSPKCDSPLVSVYLRYENEVQELNSGDTFDIPNNRSAILEAVSVDKSVITCEWHSSFNKAVVISNPSSCKTSIYLSQIGGDKIIMNLRSRNSCGAYFLFPIQIQPKEE